MKVTHSDEPKPPLTQGGEQEEAVLRRAALKAMAEVEKRLQEGKSAQEDGRDKLSGNQGPSREAREHAGPSNGEQQGGRPPEQRGQQGHSDKPSGNQGPSREARGHAGPSNGEPPVGRPPGRRGWHPRTRGPHVAARAASKRKAPGREVGAEVSRRAVKRQRRQAARAAEAVKAASGPAMVVEETGQGEGAAASRAAASSGEATEGAPVGAPAPQAVPVASTELRTSKAPWAVKARAALKSVPVGEPGEAVDSPLNWKVIAEELGPEYPDQQLLRDLREGCDMLYTGPDISTAAPNHASAMDVEEEINAQIAKELEEGIIGGGFTSEEELKQHLGVQHIRVQPLGAVAKRGSEEKRRFDDASFGVGVNAGITEVPELRYTNVDLIGSHIARMKEIYPEVTIAKCDVRHAYRIVPVSPANYHLLCFSWTTDGVQRWYYHRRLPFGTRSSPHHFSRLTVALLYHVAPLLPEGTAAHDFLDDLIVFGDAARMPQAMEVITSTMKRWAIPLNVKKFAAEGTPETTKTVLGIVLDTVRMEMRLEEGRVADIHKELRGWKRQRQCSKKKLQSLVGVLSFAAQVLQPGRLFLRRMIDTMKDGAASTEKGRARGIKLGAGFHADLQWWRDNLRGWSATSYLPSNHPSRQAQLQLATDASSVTGYGAVFQHRYLWGLWTQEELHLAKGHRSIGLMELATVLFAVAAWGPELRGMRVPCLCDNQGDVEIFRGQASKKKSYNDLLRQLHSVLVEFDIRLTVKHVPGVQNTLPDALSRGALDKYFSLSPFDRMSLQEDKVPADIRQALMRVLKHN